MNNKEIVSEEIVKVIDILEQIKDVNRMIEIHKEKDSFMLNQYVHRKDKFLKELSVLLEKFDISPTDLAA